MKAIRRYNERKLTMAAVVLGCVCGLCFYMLAYNRKPRQFPENTTKANANTSPWQRAESLEVQRESPRQDEGRTVPTGRTSLETPRGNTVGEGSAAEQVEPTADFYAPRIASYLETFLTEEPDILGWNAFFGELAMSAKLEEGSVDTGTSGETRGKVSIPGADLRVTFESAPGSYKVIMEGNLSPPGFAGTDLDFRAQLGGELADGGISKAHGAVQFLPRDDYAENALDQRIVGYVYEVDDNRTLLRPMRARMQRGIYQLNLPAEDANKLLAYGDLKPAYDWYFRLQHIAPR